MSNNLTKEEITSHIISFAIEYGLGHCKEYKELYSLVCNAKKDARYFGIMGVFEYPEQKNKLLIQTFAGRLLLKIQPKCLEDPNPSIFRLLDNWNVSAEEVIFYLAKQHGKLSLLNTINMMSAGELNKNSQAALKCMRFWLGS